MGIQTIGKNLAIGASPAVQPHPRVARDRFSALWFSAGIVLSLLVAHLAFLTYQELPHLYQVLPYLATFARHPDAPNDTLLLEVDSQGADLRVRWNRSAMAITRAQAGLLSIRDGDASPRELRLDADKLRTGSVLYSSVSNKVQFNLKLFEPDGRELSEYVLAVSPLRRPVPGNDTDSTVAVAPAKVPSALLDSSPAGADQLPEARKAIVGTKTEAAPHALPSAEQNPAGAKTPADLFPGNVVRQVLPDVSNKARRSLHGTLHVRVRVRVDPSGGVTDATLDSPGPSRYFAGRALRAARSWKFGPPKLDGRAVSSAWILRFEFRRTATRVMPERAAP